MIRRDVVWYMSQEDYNNIKYLLDGGPEKEGILEYYLDIASYSVCINEYNVMFMCWVGSSPNNIYVHASEFNRYGRNIDIADVVVEHNLLNQTIRINVHEYDVHLTIVLDTRVLDGERL